MSRDDSLLLDILNAAKRIAQITRLLDLDGFLANVDVREIVLWQFTVIGEAVRNLSPEFRDFNAAIPWRRITDMRNRLVHGYREIDLEEVWRTIQQDIPELILDIEPLVPPEEA